MAESGRQRLGYATLEVSVAGRLAREMPSITSTEPMKKPLPPRLTFWRGDQDTIGVIEPVAVSVSLTLLMGK